MGPSLREGAVGWTSGPARPWCTAAVLYLSIYLHELRLHPPPIGGGPPPSPPAAAAVDRVRRCGFGGLPGPLGAKALLPRLLPQPLQLAIMGTEGWIRMPSACCVLRKTWTGCGSRRRCAVVMRVSATGGTDSLSTAFWPTFPVRHRGSSGVILISAGCGGPRSWSQWCCL